MAPDQNKYIQGGTGQVGYLYVDDNGRYVFDLFVGGPVPYERAVDWTSEQEAHDWLREAEFERQEKD